MKIWMSNIHRIYSLWKMLSDKLGVKSVSLTQLVCRNVKRHCRTWSRQILGWCHINFIKPKTYSALLPFRAYDSPHLWNVFMRVIKHFLQSIFRNYNVCMTHFFTIFFLSFNLFIGWQLSICNWCKPFFSLLYNCQLLCFLAICFEYCSRGLPTAFFSDIAPSRMLTTNSYLIIRPIDEWLLFFNIFKSNFFFRPLKNFIIRYSSYPFYF